MQLKEDVLLEKKFYLMDEMEKHKQEALKALKKAEEMIPFLPDLKKQEYLHGVLASMAGAIILGKPKEALLNACLRLIEPLIIDFTEQFRSYRLVIIEASYHQDMFSFYGSIAKTISNKKFKDKGTQSFMFAIDCLNMAIYFNIRIRKRTWL